MPITVEPRSAALILAAALSTIVGRTQAQAPPPPTVPWQLQTSATKAGLRGIHAVGGGVAWASGTNGTVLRTEDGGSVWHSCATPPGAEKLDFRGVWAWDANTAVVMSSGTGDLSRLYKTTDGCSSWKLLYTNPDRDGFWDAVLFSTRERGVILGDPVRGKFALLSTATGGKDWAPGISPSLESAYPEEGAFAASNSNLAFPAMGVVAGSIARVPALFVAIGGTHGSRVAGLDWNLKGNKVTGEVWHSAQLPLASGTASSGVFSLAFRDLFRGLAVGGDYKKPNESNGTAAYTADGGKTWTAAAKPPHGFRSAVAWDAADRVWIAVGTNGSDVSYDDGKTWQPLDDGKWNALSLPWVVGPEGRIAKLVSLKGAAVSSPR